VPYYVVNAGRGRATHISRERVHGLALTLWSGSASTVCGLPATRDVSDVFSPAEVSCRECRRRWQLAQAAPAAGKRPRSGGGKVTFTSQEREYLAAHVPADARTATRKTGRAAGGKAAGGKAKILGLAAISTALIAAGVGLGIWATTVEAPCMRPYAECAANGHLGESLGGLALYILAAVLGLAGLAFLVGSLVAMLRRS
jgi:hypothetical protein